MPSASISPEQRRVRIYAGLTVALGAAAYANSFRGDFQFDDFPAIRENQTLLHLWPLPGPFWPPPGSSTVSGRPVLNLSFALNHALSGFSLWSYHAVNLLIHLGAALALFGIVRRTRWQSMRERPSGPGSRDFLAAAVAATWAVHPLTTSAVTYVVQRGEALAGLFYLLTLYGFIRAAAPGVSGGTGWDRRWLGFSVGCCLLGMGTKEIMVSAPLAVFLYDRTFVARSWREAWRRGKGYYLSLTATWVPLALLVASTGGNRGGTSGFNLRVSAFHYWFTQIEALTRYAQLVLWPHPLVFEYGVATFPSWLSAYLFGPLWLAVAVATAVGCGRGRPWAFCVAWCGLILAPTSVIPGTIQFAVEYRMYLPLAAIIAGLACSLQWAAGRWPWFAGVRPAAWATAVALIVVALGGATARRNWDYRSDLALWSDSVAKRPGSARAQGNLGMAFSTRGRTAEAIVRYQTALRLDSTLAETHYDLGLAYETDARPGEALAEFLSAAQIDPKFAYAQSHAGRLLDQFGHAAEAEALLRRALATDPKLSLAHGSLGVALAAQGRMAEAIPEYLASLSLEPAQADVEFDLGLALAATGRLEEAAVHDAAAARLDPKNAAAQVNLGVTLFQLGRLPAALSALQTAARLDPASAEAHGNLATALEEAGRTDEAILEYGRALQLRPTYADAHYNLGNALLRARRVAAARSEFAEAVRLDPNLAAAREMLRRLSRPPGAP